MKDKKTATHKYQVIRETYSSIKKFEIEGVSMLKAQKVTSIFELKYEIDPRTNNTVRLVFKKQVSESIKPMQFKLAQITLEELSKYRNSGTPSFVLKKDDKLYHAKIYDDINFYSANLLGQHKCAELNHECNRLSAASDELGGCSKVRNRSQCIEKYPWITLGYETFCTQHDAFVVITCLHYEDCSSK